MSSLLEVVWKVVSARLFLWGCAASFLWKPPFLSPAAGQLLLLLLLSRLMLLRPAAADAQLLLTHWCQLKQLEQSEAKTQKSHSLGLTLLDRFFRISGSVSNSQTTIATSWQIFSCSRHRHRLGICNRPCRILHICRSIQFKFKILIFKECYNFNPIPIWSFRKRTQLNNEKVKFPCFHCSVCFPPIDGASAHLRHKGGRICQKNCTHDSVSNERKEQRVAPQCGVHMPESNYLIFVINWEQSQKCLWFVCQITFLWKRWQRWFLCCVSSKSRFDVKY